MSEYKNPRPSATTSAASPDGLYDNAVTFNKLLNEYENETTYEGRELISWQKAIELFGFGVASFDFATGGTLYSKNQLIRHSDELLYRYIGAGTLPLIVDPATNPVGNPDWEAFTATAASAISSALGGSVQDHIDGEEGKAHDTIYRRQDATLAKLAAGNYGIGSKLRFDEVGGAEFDVVAGGTPNGYDILDAGGGNTAVLQIGMFINAIHFGCVDGQDNSAALKRISELVTNYSIVDLGNIEHIVSASGLPSSPYGHRIFDISGKKGVSFIGKGSRIKCVNHDIATNNGLSFLYAKGCQGLYVSGIDFDMSFTGVNTSASYYPFCGAIIGNDGSNADEGVRTQDQLNGNWTVENCDFKLFHPYGQYAQSGAAYLGDPNNGFKIFPLTVIGPFDATTYDSQCRKIVIDNCVLKEGGNSYGFWTWAWNDVTMTRCTAESFVGKQSNSAGTYSGRGEPMLRYHQFYCAGLKVFGNHFRAKPCSERLEAGFEGCADFVHYNTNLLGNYSHGNCEITGNEIILGNGDAAKSAADWGVYLIAYGSIVVGNNTIDGIADTTNAYTGNAGILWNAESVGGQGNATLGIDNNNFGFNCSYMDNIFIANGGATAANRRLKSLSVTDNTSMSQLQYFMKMATTNTAFGVESIRVRHNGINGANNTVFDKSSTNSRAIEVAGNQTTDFCDVSKNEIRDKYYGVETNGHAGRFVADYNEYFGVTARWIGAIPITSERGVGAPTATAKDGSKYTREDGALGSAVYARMGGAWIVVG